MSRSIASTDRSSASHNQGRNHESSWQVQVKPRATSAQGDVVQFADGSQTQVRTVIWATGFRQDFSWIRMPGVLDECSQPGEQQGVSTTPGLFFLGFPWQPSRGSALVGWVGKDARRLAALLQTKEQIPSQVGGYS